MWLCFCYSSTLMPLWCAQAWVAISSVCWVALWASHTKEALGRVLGSSQMTQSLVLHGIHIEIAEYLKELESQCCQVQGELFQHVFHLPRIFWWPGKLMGEMMHKLSSCEHTRWSSGTQSIIKKVDDQQVSTSLSNMTTQSSPASPQLSSHSHQLWCFWNPLITALRLYKLLLISVPFLLHPSSKLPNTQYHLGVPG